MKFYLAQLVVLGIMLTGCAQTMFYHPTKNMADFERDKYDCTVEAEHSASSTGQDGFWIAQRRNYCLQAKHGWSKEPQQREYQQEKLTDAQLEELFKNSPSTLNPATKSIYQK